MSNRSLPYLTGLVTELRGLPRETEWVEFKQNNADPQEIGEYVSALANAAALNDKPHGYLVWGIADGTHKIVGTSFSPAGFRRGNEPIETWLLRLVSPGTGYHFHELSIEGQRVVILEVERAFDHPVRFQGEPFIRVGPVKKPLKAAPDRERTLWRVFDRTPFERLIAADHVTAGDVLQLLDYPAYFVLLEQAPPDGRERILATLASDGLIARCTAGGWDITNLGAMLFAKRLAGFPSLARKAVRVIQYRGRSRLESLREQVGVKGYAAGFDGVIGYLDGILPASESVGPALRKSVRRFPQLAIRELVANALIHQDFHMTGAGPLIEVFDDRIEITNPGVPLVEVNRFLDTPPRSRNEALASLTRRLRICEERGSGIDKVISEVEAYHLPPPLFEAPKDFTRVVLFAHRPLADMVRQDRIRACYFHACLCFVNRQPMSNASLRARFDIDEKNAATVSRLLGEAVESGAIVIQNPDEGTKSRRYLPCWAADDPKHAEFA